MPDIKLELTVDEVNTILRSLGKHPFEEIANLIVKIKNQGEPQVAAAEEAAIAAAIEDAAEPAGNPAGE